MNVECCRHHSDAIATWLMEVSRDAKRYGGACTKDVRLIKTKHADRYSSLPGSIERLGLQSQ